MVGEALPGVPGQAAPGSRTLARSAGAAASSLNAVFYDEEDCLGFGVFAAELELIVGSARERRPDQVALLELLQKLASSIAVAKAPELKAHQRRAEAALYDVLSKGCAAPVRLPA